MNSISETTKEASCAISIDHVSKSYGDLNVLDQVSYRLESGRIYCLTGFSGRGKTTLLRLILGLEAPDGGKITCLGKENTSVRFSAVFQEDRLCETFSPLDNVLLTADKRYSRQQIQQELCRLLPKEAVSRPVQTLSGGMKRRVAIARSLLAPADIIVMDEPFTGLDEDTRRHVIRYILEKQDGRLILISTHQEEDIPLLGADVIRL